jgi:hypothetical protein
MSESNQLLKVAAMALRVARRCVSEYGSIKSRHDFTQPQLVAVLVVRAYLKATYRGITEILGASGQLRRALGLDHAPHWTTLQKCAARKGMLEVIGASLGQVLVEVGAAERCEDVAADSTSMQIGAASAHYRARSGRPAVGYVKLSLAVICGLLLPAAMVVDHGPSPDAVQMPELLRQAVHTVKPNALYADKGYDSEWVHEFCREDWGVSSWIPPVPRTRDGSIKTRYRAKMVDLPKAYGRRWHAESFFSGLKRSTLSTLASRRRDTLLTEAAFRVLAYAIRR